MSSRRFHLFLRSTLLLALASAQVPATSGAGQTPAPALGLGARVVPLVTHVSPAIGGEDRTEGYLTQPALMVHAAPLGGALALTGMLNLEGLTLRRGELNPGIWGEGYVDRRHPHTYLHEMMASLRLRQDQGVAASISLGKGFAPFGTDDPMVRPFVKYPINHHFAQILERAVVVGALRTGRVGVEAGAFNGDEPVGPEDFANLGRFGDSWAARLTLWPLQGMEAQGSHAWVVSPELPSGGGTDQQKWSASIRYAPARGGSYLLAEWASTSDWDDGRRGSSYTSLLGEGTLAWRGVSWGLRYERTERPEEERLLDPFRTLRPHAGAHLLGITRWDILTLNAVGRVRVADWLQVHPFVEAARLAAHEKVRPSFFEPKVFYGSDRIWSLSAGMRVEAGMFHSRMGRYGAAAQLSLNHMHAGQ